MYTSRIKTGLIMSTLLMLAAISFNLSAEESGKSFKDWGYKCETPQGSDQKICFIFQRITSKKDDKRVADATIAYLPNVDKPVMVITLPLGVFLPAGIQLKIDDSKEAANAPYVQCIQDGCQARIAMDDKMITKMKGGKMLNIAFLTPQQKQLGFPISLSGFTAAIDSLKK